MIRILFVAFLLTGCGCAQQPILPEAQAQISELASAYKLAHLVEQKFCRTEQLPQPCIAARKAGYNVEAAFSTANSERTDAAIGEARRKMIGYQTAVEALL